MKFKSLHMPKNVIIEEVTLSDDFGVFRVSPLERGFGITLGTALRRVLLSSIQGGAISAIRIENVHHEFSTIPGLVEDVPEIILNLKGVRLKLISDEPLTIRVEKKGKGFLTAGDLQVDPRIKIINTNHHIAELDKDGEINMELYIDDGRGYVAADEKKLEDQPVDTILIDSIYSPVRKVNFHTENVRVGDRTDYDKLTLEVSTDGSVRSDDAVAFAAKILTDHLLLFINQEINPVVEEEKEINEEALKVAEKLSMSVEELELSVRSSNCLRAQGINYLKDLVQRTEREMLKYRNFGRKSLSELEKILGDMDLSFNMDVTKYFSPEELESEKENKEKEETDATYEEGEKAK